MVAAIEELLHELRAGGIAARFNINDEIERLPRPLETAIYRIIQEALNNARKHSGSDRVEVPCTATTATSNWKCATLVAASTSGTGEGAFGLLGMAERVRLLGGECRVESQPGSGTRISAKLPVASAAPSSILANASNWT